MVSSPADEAEAARLALVRNGAEVETSRAEDEVSLLRSLRSPLDLVLVWVLAPERAERPDREAVLSPARATEVVLARGSGAPLYAMIAPGDEERALELLDLGVEGLVYRDRPAPLAGIAERVGWGSRRRDLVELVRAASHDLNNLLAPVPLATRILRDELESAEATGFLEMVESSVERSTAAVESLYRVALWSYAERGATPAAIPAPDRVRVQLRHLIEATARELRATCSELAVETDYPPELPPIEASPGELRQILHCLALHAAGDRTLSTVPDAGAREDRETVRFEAQVQRDGGAEGEGVVVSVSGPALGRAGAETSALSSALHASVARLGGRLDAVAASERGRAVLRLSLPAGARPDPST